MGEGTERGLQVTGWRRLGYKQLSSQHHHQDPGYPSTPEAPPYLSGVAPSGTPNSVSISRGQWGLF